MMATERSADLFEHEALYDFEDPNSRRRRRYEAARERNAQVQPFDLTRLEDNNDDHR
jgi:hypothetical protein